MMRNYYVLKSAISENKIDGIFFRDAVHNL